MSSTVQPFTVQRNPHPLSDAERAAALVSPAFGQFRTDHMVKIDWTAAGGWGPGAVLPYGPLALDPATSALHYGQLIFEGLKAYRQPDGSIATFRPLANAARLARSAHRLAMPELPAELFLESIRALVDLDQAWVDHDPEASLYLRPFMMATEAALGVRAANAYSYLLIASPVGAYFSGGVKPVTVWLSTEFSRAAPGGTGDAKCAGNYAASLLAQAQAAEQGCDQVVWLDAVEHRYVEEMGGMNLYFVYGSGADARLVTPKLTGTLLPGITRDSLLTLAQDLGHGTDEAVVSTEDWQAGNASGELTEVFACGTAAVITPVGRVKSAGAEWTVGDGGAGPVTMRLRKALLDLQTGRAPDPHGWMHRLS
ncbi:MAG: branched-chain amino acid aminotransferase [Jatrophihabitantaceae bacterium]